jgi:eukaryotic-like serine/threonine-protein kinase
VTAVSDNIPAGFGAHWLARLGVRPVGEVVTFYSYKGGTGRSMALVNCAGLIAQHLPAVANPILIVDFDLEAPGLHRYLAPFLGPGAGGVGKPGVLELFAALAGAVDEALPNAPPAVRGEAARLSDDAAAAIVDAVSLGDFIDDTQVTGLKLMTAGCFDDSYDRRLTRFDWEGLHRKAPALFRCLGERLAREYCFTFVDSRTGLSDTSGICTMLLPDVLVMVFTPNQQSLTGIDHLVRRAVEYRSGAADSRALRVYPLPSRVDNQVESFRQVWRHGTAHHELFGRVTGYQPMFSGILESTLGMDGADASLRLTEYFDVVQVPHSADYSYGERLCFDPDAPSDSLSIRGAYEQFLPWLVTGAQPWQRPADALLNQQSAAWLHEAGADKAPEDDEWAAWFDRLAVAVRALGGPALASSALSRLAGAAEHCFDVNMAVALGLAWGGELVDSNRFLVVAGKSFNEELGIVLPDSAPVVLLQWWVGHFAPAELNSADRITWLATLEAVLGQWQPLKGQKIRWLSAVADLAEKAAWPDNKRNALTELVAVSEEALGSEHEQTLRAKTRLARSQRAAGLHREARAINEQVFETLRRLFGDEHRDTLAARGNLAQTLSAQGDLAGARAHQEAVLEASRRLLGEEHPDTLTARNNLASTLSAQGDLAGARAHEEVVLEASRRLLGEHHSDTLTAMENLVFIMRDQGELAAATSLQRQLLDTGRRAFGESHASTLPMTRILADMLLEAGDRQLALTLYEETFMGMRATFGANNEDTWSSAMALATVALDLGDAGRAAEVLDSVSEARQSTDNGNWVGLRLRVAERLDDHETAQRLRRRQYGLLKPQGSAFRGAARDQA